MKRFIVAVATDYYSVDKGEETITRFYATHATTKEVAAKRVMLEVTAGDKVWTQNNAMFRCSSLIFAEVLGKRKIRALNAGYTVSLAERINARADLSFGRITSEEYRAFDKMHDMHIAILDAIEK